MTKDEYIEFLKDSDIFNLYIKELGKFIVGELEARHVLFLCAQGRLVDNYEPCSYHVLVNSESGAGKDWVMRHIVKLLPEEVYEYRTRISKKAFTYWHSSRIERDWSWDGKICYLEDVSNEVLNDDTFKVMASSGSNATIVVENHAVDVKINGKPVIFLTSATASPKHELLRRFVIVGLNETIDQTKDVMKKKAKAAKEGTKQEIKYDPIFIGAQRHLERVKVLVPFADLLVDIFPSDHIIMRTLFSRFIDWVKASCAFHQHQRERNDAGFYIATEQDYAIARKAIEYVSTNRFMLPLTKDELRLFDIIVNLSEDFSVNDIAAKVSFITERTLRRKLDKLANYGFLEKSTTIVDWSNRPIIVYKAKQLGAIKLPSWSELLTNRHLDNYDNNDKLT